MSTAKQKKKWNYRYDYPEQKELFKGLGRGDMTLIAEKTGLTRQYVYMMSRGERKITPEIETLVNKITRLRNEINSVEI